MRFLSVMFYHYIACSEIIISETLSRLCTVWTVPKNHIQKAIFSVATNEFLNCLTFQCSLMWRHNVYYGK
jgi:hypothetical protein